MPAGRPSTYSPDYIPRVLECGAQGKSLVQISAALDVPKSTLQSWAQAHPEFSAALTRAKELEQAWWEARAQAALDAPVFQAQVWKTSMQARFRHDYTERKEVTGADGGAVKVDAGDAGDVARRVAFLLMGGMADDKDAAK